MEPITPIINDQTIEIEHAEHGTAHCDVSTFPEWKKLGWKKPAKKKEEDKPTPE